MSCLPLLPASMSVIRLTRLNCVLQWCISRQRSWGVPIPAFYDAETGEVLLNEVTMKHFEKCVAELGSDCWWTLTMQELLPAEYQDGRQWVRGYDTQMSGSILVPRGLQLCSLDCARTLQRRLLTHSMQWPHRCASKAQISTVAGFSQACSLL